MYFCYLFEDQIKFYDQSILETRQIQAFLLNCIWVIKNLFYSLSKEREFTPLSDCTVDSSDRLCSILEEDKKKKSTILCFFQVMLPPVWTQTPLKGNYIVEPIISHSQVPRQYESIVIAPVSPAGTCTQTETRRYGLGRTCWMCLWRGRWVLGQPGGFPAAGPAGTGSEKAQCTPRPGCF